MSHLRTARPNVFAMAAILIVMVAMPLPAAARAAPGCTDVVLEGEMRVPAGTAVRRIIKLDAQCRPIAAPDETLTAAQLDAVLRSGQAPTQVSDRIPSKKALGALGRAGLARPNVMVAGGPIHMFNRIKDVAGLTVTSIDPHNFSYGYNGSTITSTNHDATVNRATDTECGTGWSVVWANTSISISGGGVGWSFADSLTHAEFSYQGRFDCSGNDFYNILDTKLTGFGNGAPSTCAYRTQLRKTYFGWYQELLCWDAYVWTTPPPF